MYIEESIWGYVIMMVMVYGLDLYTRRMRRNPNEPMTKTKWYKDGVKYWEVKGSKNTYVVKTNGNNLLECECLGFTYRKNCKHIKEIVNKIRKNLDEV